MSVTIYFTTLAAIAAILIALSKWAHFVIHKDGWSERKRDIIYWSPFAFIFLVIIPLVIHFTGGQ